MSSGQAAPAATVPSLVMPSSFLSAAPPPIVNVSIPIHFMHPPNNNQLAAATAPAQINIQLSVQFIPSPNPVMQVHHQMQPFLGNQFPHPPAPIIFAPPPYQGLLQHPQQPGLVFRGYLPLGQACQFDGASSFADNEAEDEDFDDDVTSSVDEEELELWRAATRQAMQAQLPVDVEKDVKLQQRLVTTTKPEHPKKTIDKKNKQRKNKRRTRQYRPRKCKRDGRQ
eukprot:TRINITY_DN20737_c0_g1_i1.p1 TRINITY_DN20737_c0_g1~~TRINITY_DN20737_c0_g1_i1.p1  ORF type:complete len:225 (+),score=39.64 TRINITY_DN20737_c0_g1_i1:298-972(+)